MVRRSSTWPVLRLREGKDPGRSLRK
jgi:hypothetical protein